MELNFEMLCINNVIPSITTRRYENESLRSVFLFCKKFSLPQKKPDRDP